MAETPLEQPAAAPRPQLAEPFPTLVRFALFLLIPLGSWLEGSMVERVVDPVLD